MKRLQLFLATIIVTGIFFFFTKEAFASEGTIEMLSTTDERYRCWVASVRMQNQEFRIVFTCRDLIYPVDDNVFNYMLWTTPVDGSKPVKLGVLGLGKGEFRTQKPFSALFVTTEKSKDVRSPQSPVVMRGSVESLESFFGQPPTPTPTPSPEEEVKEEGQELTTRQKLLLALRRAGIAALIALVAIIGLVFVITRSRG